MPLQTFRHYTICQDSQGATVEVWRDADEVACLAFDNKQRHFVELHVAIGPAERSRDAASFQNLVQLAAPLRHRHLLGIIEGGEDEGSNYHISEFLDGERLDTWLARCHPVPPWLALHIIRQIVEGLAALASHPRLLAGVEVFHAGLTLSGPHPDDLNVKLCGLGLSGTLPVSTEPQFVEARAIHETGRLLVYMLTGSVEAQLAGNAQTPPPGLPPELGFLLNTIFQATQSHHPRTLEQLRTLTERCAHDLSPELTARPDLLPVQFRPRLPLAAHLSPDPAAAEILSNDFTLDHRPADAADPYRQRGTERATRRAVNLQLLPPPHLLPPGFLVPALEKAWTTLSNNRAPNLLSPLAWHPEAPAPLLVEELPGKFTLDSLRRLRGPLEPAEVHLILAQLDAAASEAEARDLPLHWRSPRLIPVQFTNPGGEEALPPPAQLARLSLTDWPAFTLKLRTWPLTLDFTQPDRFQLERLLPRDPALTGESARASNSSSATAAPSARDFALLATWLLGGSALVKENLKPLLYAAISARGPALAGRKEFLERFRQRLISSPPAPAPAPAPTPSSSAKSKSKARRKSAPVPVAAGAAGAAFLTKHPSDGTTPLAEEETTGLFPPSHPAPATDEDAPAMGFAEALFGPAAASSAQNLRSAHLHAVAAPHPVWPAAPPDDDTADLPYPSDAPPLGFMEAAGQSSGWNPDHDIDYEDHDGRKSTSRWILFLVVILIAAAIAALMAQLSGQAIWLK